MKQFKDFINEARTLPEFEAIRANFNMVVLDGLNMVINGQVTHWTVRYYSTHEALGEFYNALKEQLDHLVESGIAVGYDVKDLRDNSFYIQGDSIESFEDKMMQYRETVSNTISMCPSNMSVIQDILVAIQKTIDDMSYKLTLS